MSWSEFIEKVLVPMVSPLIAVVGIYFAIQSEGRKIRLQRAAELARGANSIVAKTIYCESLAKLLLFQARNNSDESARLLDFQAKTTLLLDEIFLNPEVGLKLEAVYGGIDRSNIFLLLAECRARCAELSKNKEIDLLIYFTLLSLLYLFDKNQHRRESAYTAMNKIRDEKPEIYSKFFISPLAHPLSF